jgi:hypothetical protein
VVWAIGFTREPAVRYVTLDGNAQNRILFYQNSISNDSLLVYLWYHSFFAVLLMLFTQVGQVLDDFNGALDRSSDFDNLAKIADNAIPGSNYSDLISLVARQAFGSTELTTGMGSDGKTNTSDVMMFIRDSGTENERLFFYMFSEVVFDVIQQSSASG